MAKQQLINRAKYKDIKDMIIVRWSGSRDHCMRVVSRMERTGNGNGKIQYETDGF